MAGGAVFFDQSWLMVPLTYGFAARVASGPRFSPLGQLATKVITPRLPGRHRLVPGPPKRLAQGMGLAMAGTATALHFGLGKPRAAKAVLGGLIFAAGLESAFGICLACRIFPYLARTGLVSEETCAECLDISGRLKQEAN